MRDPYSHLHASVSGWGWVPAPEDVLFLNWVDATAQMNKRKNAAPIKPVVRPWERARREVPVVRHDPARNERRAKLRERLGLK